MRILFVVKCAHTKAVEFLSHDTNTLNVRIRKFTIEYMLPFPGCNTPHFCLQKFCFSSNVSPQGHNMPIRILNTLFKPSSPWMYPHITLQYMEYLFPQRIMSYLKARTMYLAILYPYHLELSLSLDSSAKVGPF